jgi:hypothetical protein
LISTLRVRHSLVMVAGIMISFRLVHDYLLHSLQRESKSLPLFEVFLHFYIRSWTTKTL